MVATASPTQGAPCSFTGAPIEATVVTSTQDGKRAPRQSTPVDESLRQLITGTVRISGDTSGGTLDTIATTMPSPQLDASSERGSPVSKEDKDRQLIFDPSPEITALSQAGGVSMLVQTIAATLFASLILILPLAFVLAFINVAWARIPLAGYVAFCYLDPAASNGIGRRMQWVRALSAWKYLIAYFPVRVVLERRLDPGRSYVFGVSPHGILCYAGQIAMSWKHGGMDAALEGITVHTAALRPILTLPLFRDYIMALGAISSSRRSIRRCLARGNGHSVAIVIGGAKESLHTNRGSRKLVLMRRKGFVREAIMAGAPLVPVFAFGENDILSQVESPCLRRIQCWLQAKVKFALPIAYGRYGIIPHRTPLTIVIGSPIFVEQSSNPATGDIDAAHAKYVSELRRIYTKFRPIYDPLGDDLVIV